MTFVSSDLQHRFEIKVIPEPMSGCFLWLGAANPRGYGQIRTRDGTVLATHVALALAGRARTSTAMLACHTCDNPTCVNEQHLFWGSHIDNMADATRKGRMAWQKMRRLAGQ